MRSRPRSRRGRDHLDVSFACDQRSAAGAAQGVGDQGGQHDSDCEPHGMVAPGTELFVTHDVHLALDGSFTVTV